jgi:hypothetical protein
MNIAQWALIISLLALVLSGSGFYYQYLRGYHHLSVAILQWTYDDDDLSVSLAFVNYGNKDEVVLNARPIVAADKSKPQWETTRVERDWLWGAGEDSFIIPAGAVVVKRVDLKIAGAKLPSVESNDVPKDRQTDVGLLIFYLGRNAEFLQKTEFFAHLRIITTHPEMFGGGFGFARSRIDPRSFDLLKYNQRWPRWGRCVVH